MKRLALTAVAAVALIGCGSGGGATPTPRGATGPAADALFALALAPHADEISTAGDYATKAGEAIGDGDAAAALLYVNLGEQAWGDLADLAAGLPGADSDVGLAYHEAFSTCEDALTTSKLVFANVTESGVDLATEKLTTCAELLTAAGESVPL